MISISTLTKSGAKTFARTTLLLKKHSPEIMLGLGVVGGVTATVMACKATLKIDQIKADAKAELEKIVTGKEEFKDAKKEDGTPKYTEEDFKKDIQIVQVHTAAQLVRNYLPAIAVGAGSVALILASHGIMSKRNAAAVAAYGLLDRSFKIYRKRVKDELGDSADRHFQFGTNEKVVAEIVGQTPEGEPEVEEKVVALGRPVCMEDLSPYVAVYGPETTTQWQNNYTYNLFFLRGQQNQINDTLHARGHVFLNEVFDNLGMQRTEAGQFVGWVEDNGDSYITFNLESPVNQPDHISDNPPFLLDFNVDGPVYQLIEKKKKGDK